MQQLLSNAFALLATTEGTTDSSAFIDYLKSVFVSPFGNVLFLVFLIAFLSYALGKIKGVGLGAAGVFLMALVFGHFGAGNNSWFHQIGLVTIDEAKMKSAMKLVQDIGLLCFVTSVGFIAGPKFFSNLKRNAKSYAFIGFCVIGSAALVTAIIIMCTPINAAMGVGILSGALTTTPGFAAAQDALLSYENSESPSVTRSVIPSASSASSSSSRSFRSFSAPTSKSNNRSSSLPPINPANASFPPTFSSSTRWDSLPSLSLSAWVSSSVKSQFRFPAALASPWATPAARSSWA